MQDSMELMYNLVDILTKKVEKGELTFSMHENEIFLQCVDKMDEYYDQ